MDCPLFCHFQLLSVYLFLAAPLSHPYIPIICCLPGRCWAGRKLHCLVVVCVKLEGTHSTTRILGTFPQSEVLRFNYMEFGPRYCLTEGQFLLTLGCSVMFHVVEFAQSPAAGKIGFECTAFALDFENDTSSIPSAAALLP